MNEIKVKDHFITLKTDEKTVDLIHSRQESIIATLENIFKDPLQPLRIRPYAMEDNVYDPYTLKLTMKKPMDSLFTIYVELLKELPGRKFQTIGQQTDFRVTKMEGGSHLVTAYYHNPTKDTDPYLREYSSILQEVDEAVCQWLVRRSGHEVKRIIEPEVKAMAENVRSREGFEQVPGKNEYVRIYKPSKKE